MKNSPSKASSRKTTRKGVADASSSPILFSIQNTTRRKVPRLPFEKIAQAILRPGYDMSLVIIGDRKARALNRAHRHKDTPANVLSFPLSKNAGEIFLNLDRAEREAADFGSSYRSHLGFLFIHGLLHLEGYDHGSTMESIERKVRRRFRL